MKIVVAGYGPVGQAIVEALLQHPGEIDYYIDDPAKDHKYDTSIGDSPDAVVVCVATPMNKDGSCNITNVESVFRKYGDTKYLIKSAVDPVWLTQHAKAFKGSYTCSPEFLGGSNVNRDPTVEFLLQEYAIYGGDDCRWWDELFRACLPKLKTVKYCSLEQAAFAKYVENCFLATKVTFFNEMYKIYNECGFDGFDMMVDAITIDPRIGRSHTQVPGPDGKFGWGGHCLPKDVSALRMLSKHSPLLDAVVDTNEEHRS